MLSYSHENWFFCKELAPESDQGQQATPDTAEVSADSGDLQEGKNIEKGKDKEEKDKEKTKDSDKEKGKEKEADKKGEIEKEKLKSMVRFIYYFYYSWMVATLSTCMVRFT